LRHFNLYFPMRFNVLFALLTIEKALLHLPSQRAFVQKLRNTLLTKREKFRVGLHSILLSVTSDWASQPAFCITGH
jgi:hypothetical protein